MISEVVLPILFKGPDGSNVHLGTGFVIAAMGKHAIVVTAAHVLKEAISRTRKRKASSIFQDGTKETMVARVRDDHELFVLFERNGRVHYGEVVISWGHVASDLALLCVDLPLDSDYLSSACMNINSRGPNIGEQICAYGYFDLEDRSVELIPPGFEALFGPDTGRGPQFIEGKRSQTIFGKVVEVLPEGDIFIRHACFRADLPFHSGMSGGPVVQIIDGNLVVCGVISSDSSADELRYGTGERAIASILEPLLSLDLVVDGHYPLTYSYMTKDGPSRPLTVRRLADLVEEGVVSNVARA